MAFTLCISAIRSETGGTRLCISWAGAALAWFGWLEIHGKSTQHYHYYFRVLLTPKSSDNKWVALKICRANVTDHRSEVSKLDTLRSSNASKYVSELLNHFTIQGPNGTHLCIVTEFLGPSINDVIYYYVEQCASDRMDADDVLRTSRLLLEATTALHAAGFAHGGTTQTRYFHTRIKLT